MHFQAQDQYWIGSADMMHRNLDRRVEVMAQVKDPRLTEQLGMVFDSALHPMTRCWVLQADGSWHARPEQTGTDGEQVRDHQEFLMRLRRPDQP
jgi:polyphosphate kinase